MKQAVWLSPEPCSEPITLSFEQITLRPIMNFCPTRILYSDFPNENITL